MTTPRPRRRHGFATPFLRRLVDVCWLLLLAAGVTLLLAYTTVQVDGARGRERALQALAEVRHERLLAPAAPAAPAAPEPAAHLEYSVAPDQSLWGKARIAAYRDSLNKSRDAPIGVLTIPSTRLKAPIFDGTAETTLNRGIGRIEGTAEVGASGNLGLAAHRDGFFRSLKDVRVGAAIDVESLSGTTRYRVAKLMIVEPTDVYVLAPTNRATLTLVSCYPFYFIGDAPQRYIVKAIIASTTGDVQPAPEIPIVDAADARTERVDDAAI